MQTLINTDTSDLRRIKASLGLSPVKTTKEGHLYRAADVAKVTANAINNDEKYYTKKATKMSRDIDNAKKITDDAIDSLAESINKFTEIEQNLSDATKKATGGVRDSANKLANGMKKIEALANYTMLEKQVELLERAEAALIALSVLEQSGKLDKILNAIK